MLEPGASIAVKNGGGLEIEPSVVARGAPRKQFRSLHIIGEKPPYTLHITVGDPDSGRALQFQRQ